MATVRRDEQAQGSVTSETTPTSEGEAVRVPVQRLDALLALVDELPHTGTGKIQKTANITIRVVRLPFIYNNRVLIRACVLGVRLLDHNTVDWLHTMNLFLLRITLL